MVVSVTSQFPRSIFVYQLRGNGTCTSEFVFVCLFFREKLIFRIDEKRFCLWSLNEWLSARLLLEYSLRTNSRLNPELSRKLCWRGLLKDIWRSSAVTRPICDQCHHSSSSSQHRVVEGRRCPQVTQSSHDRRRIFRTCDPDKVNVMEFERKICMLMT